MNERSGGAQVRRHVLSRWPILLGGVALASLGSVWAILPARDEATVVAMLARGAGGQVVAEDYVWEPSHGWFDDLSRGRGVVFLARRADGEPRDAYRARVRVTPGGRPLSLRDSQRLTASAAGDETDLSVSERYAAFTTRFNGRYQSVTVTELVEGSPTWVVPLPRPTDRVELEVRGGELLVAWDQKTSVFELAKGEAVAGSPLPILRAPTLQPDDAVDTDAVHVWGPTDGVDEFPPPGFAPARVLAPGRDAAIATKDDGAVTGVALDGRQLRFAIVMGTTTPRSATGFVVEGELPAEARGAQLSFAMPIPMRAAPNAAGAFVNGDWIAPIERDRLAVGATPKGELLLGRWGLSPWELPQDVAIGVEWAGSEPQSGRHAVCVTPAGHLAISWSASAVDDALRSALPAACTIAFSAPGVIEGAEWQQGFELARATGPMLVAWAAELAPRLPPPKGVQWSKAEAGLPAPAFMPAIHRAEVEALGATVTVSEIDASRFEWRLVAGSEERSHRKKGSFAERLPEVDVGRAKIAFSLGTGKRKRPRGLRIAGSTGHDFSHKEPALRVGAGFVGLLSGGALPDDGDACELGATISGGELLDAARVPLPRQAQADLCALANGRVLVAEAVFDSHEATAGTLLSMGCEIAVALDRGSERAAWRRAGAESAGPFETTALIGLERPLFGVVRSREWKPAEADP